MSKALSDDARAITKYIMDHQDNMADEDRWRTGLKRMISDGFRDQQETFIRTQQGVLKELLAPLEAQLERHQHQIDRVTKVLEMLQAVPTETMDASPTTRPGATAHSGSPTGASGSPQTWWTPDGAGFFKTTNNRQRHNTMEA